MLSLLSNYCIIWNGQKLHSVMTSVKRWSDKEWMLYTHNETLLVYEEKWIHIFREGDRTGNHCVKLNTPYLESQPHV